jgi:hypothetical protein
MAIKGAESKNIITQKILETFGGSFLYNDGKEIRVPMLENGETVQIKVTLTAAKVNVSPEGETALPGEDNTDLSITFSTNMVEKTAPTAEEKKNVADLLKSLGL